jgi:hypothetical protein
MRARLPGFASCSPWDAREVLAKLKAAGPAKRGIERPHRAWPVLTGWSREFIPSRSDLPLLLKIGYFSQYDIRHLGLRRGAYKTPIVFECLSRFSHLLITATHPEMSVC